MWRNHGRDILLADYYCDYHIGDREDHELGEVSLTPPRMWVKVKGVNVLFLDLHLKAVTPAQRKEYQDYTTGVDNPYNRATR
jgi:hypothetical protein